MRVYPDQPDDYGRISIPDFTRYIVDFLKEELPDCIINEWFIESIYFANMVDKLVEELTREFANS